MITMTEVTSPYMAKQIKYIIYVFVTLNVPNVVIQIYYLFIQFFKRFFEDHVMILGIEKTH